MNHAHSHFGWAWSWNRDVFVYTILTSIPSVLVTLFCFQLLAYSTACVYCGHCSVIVNECIPTCCIICCTNYYSSCHMTSHPQFDIQTNIVTTEEVALSPILSPSADHSHGQISMDNVLDARQVCVTSRELCEARARWSPTEPQCNTATLQTSEGPFSTDLSQDAASSLGLAKGEGRHTPHTLEKYTLVFVSFLVFGVPGHPKKHEQRLQKHLNTSFYKRQSSPYRNAGLHMLYTWHCVIQNFIHNVTSYFVWIKGYLSICAYVGYMDKKHSWVGHTSPVTQNGI